MNRELDISKFQKKYRDQANTQSISNCQREKRRKLEKSIERLAAEIENLNKTLHIVQSKANRQRNDQFIHRLEALIVETKRHNKLIDSTKMTVHQLRQQIIRTDCERLQCERKSISDHEYAAKLAKARKTVTILETQLDANRSKENKFKSQNSQLLIVIRDAIIGRIIFNRMWTNMVTRLNFDRKMVITMVDRVLLAYSYGKRMCHQIDSVREKEKHQIQLQIGKMSDIVTSIEQDAIAVELFQQKARVIPYKELDAKETARRTQFKTSQAAMTAKLRDVRIEIGQHANEHQTKAAIEKYIHHKRQYFAYCLYLNEIENKITSNGKLLADVRKNIELGHRNAETFGQKQHRIEMLRSRLLDERCNVQKNEQQLSAIDENLRKSYNEIDSMFETLKCDVNGISIVIEFENERVDETNYLTFLSSIETRIKQIISFVYRCERERDDENYHTMIVKNVDIVKCNRRTSAASNRDVVPQCAECVEAEDLARPDIDAPLDRSEIRRFIQENLPKTDLNSRVHHIENCPRPASRALLAKRV